MRRSALEEAAKLVAPQEAKRLQVDLKVTSRSSELAYLPAYILEYAYGTTLNTSQERVSQKFQAVVGAGVAVGGSGGTMECVSGERHYSPVKVQAAIGALCASGVGLDYLGSGLVGLAPISPELALTATFVLCGLGSVAARRATNMKRQEGENKLAETEEESYDYHRLHDESVLQRVEENEWRRWEESEKWNWQHRYRKKWADNLFSKQKKRRRDLALHQQVSTALTRTWLLSPLPFLPSLPFAERRNLTRSGPRETLK